MKNFILKDIDSQNENFSYDALNSLSWIVGSLCGSILEKEEKSFFISTLRVTSFFNFRLSSISVSSRKGNKIKRLLPLVLCMLWVNIPLFWGITGHFFELSSENCLNSWKRNFRASWKWLAILFWKLSRALLINLWSFKMASKSPLLKKLFEESQKKPLSSIQIVWDSFSFRRWDIW